MEVKTARHLYVAAKTTLEMGLFAPMTELDYNAYAGAARGSLIWVAEREVAGHIFTAIINPATGKFYLELTNAETLESEHAWVHADNGEFAEPEAW